jgi:hypothetical protein
VCTTATATPRLLWPPNHEFAPVSIGGVTDADGDRLTITVTRIWQDEPTLQADGDDRDRDDDGGSGNTPVDGRIVNGGAQVRAERLGTGDGRLYEIFFTATDAKGGSCTGTATVGVPHDQGGRSTVIDSAVRFDSTVAGGPVVFGAAANRPPLAAADSATTRKNTSTTISVLSNDSDPDRDRLTVVSATPGAHGVTSLRTDGAVVYTPASTYTGTDTFTYSIADGHGGIAAAVVTVTIKK